MRAVVQFIKVGLGLEPNVQELEGGEVSGAKNGVIPIEDEDCITNGVLCWFFFLGI